MRGGRLKRVHFEISLNVVRFEIGAFFKGSPCLEFNRGRGLAILSAASQTVPAQLLAVGITEGAAVYLQ